MPGRVHLGWQRWPQDAAGRWLLRRYVGNRKYRRVPLGLADDAAPADGIAVLNFAQAEAKARAMAAAPGGAKVIKLTVRQALARYIDYKQASGRAVRDLVSRAAVHILPALGDLFVEDLTAEHLRNWLATMAATPAQTRPSPSYAREA
ncbi:MAG: hypothetical protein ACLP19_22565 [Xanthobacteraceae bacterium]